MDWWLGRSVLSCLRRQIKKKHSEKGHTCVLEWKFVEKANVQRERPSESITQNHIKIMQ